MTHLRPPLSLSPASARSKVVLDAGVCCLSRPIWEVEMGEMGNDGGKFALFPVPRGPLLELQEADH
jgi:hypothetical protein